jgi:hypothetical protein
MSDIAITDTPRLKKDKRGRFVKGNAGGGNPGGRPKSEHWLNQRIDEDLPSYYDRLKHIALNGHEAHSVQAIQYLANRRFGKPKTQVQVESTIEQRFVIRVPPVMDSAEAFERKYNPELNDFLDVKPVATDAKPHAAYQAPELPAIPQPEQPHPVRSRPQGHVGGAMPALNLNPSQVFDAGDAKNWRGQTQLMKEVANGS